MIWTFKQERNCCTISVCYSGCEMTPRRDSFARRQPPIQPVLDASFLLMQRSGTHALFVKLTGSHLPVLRVRSFVLIVLCRGEKIKQKSIFFLLIPGIFFGAAQNLNNPLRRRALTARRAPSGQKRRADDFKQRRFRIVIFMPLKKTGKRSLKFIVHHTHTSLSVFFILQYNFHKVNNHLFYGNYNCTENLIA